MIDEADELDTAHGQVVGNVLELAPSPGPGLPGRSPLAPLPAWRLTLSLYSVRPGTMYLRVVQIQYLNLTLNHIQCLSVLATMRAHDSESLIRK